MTGHILLGALKGDADLTGDTASVAAPGGTVSLSGTNNPVVNFFPPRSTTHPVFSSLPGPLEHAIMMRALEPISAAGGGG